MGKKAFEKIREGLEDALYYARDMTLSEREACERITKQMHREAQEALRRDHDSIKARFTTTPST